MSEAHRLNGTPLSAGFASGPVWCAWPEKPVYLRKGAAAEEELALRIAVTDSIIETATMIGASDSETARILELQLAMLESAGFLEMALDRIAAGMDAGAAWLNVINTEIDDCRRSRDVYFVARAGDARDIRDRTFARLAGHQEQAIPAGAILVSDCMTPTAFLKHDWTAGGLVLRSSDPVCHVSDLARLHGVPAIGGVGNREVPEGAFALLDAEAGTLIHTPDEAETAAFEENRRRFEASQDHDEPTSGKTSEPVTAAGSPAFLLHGR